MTTFQIDVSRLATGKDGYRRNKYHFGNSFQTETHTIDSLAKTIAGDGYPVTMVHRHEPPGPEAKKRGVSTYRHTENFISQQVLFLDDDRQQAGVIDFWLSDDFFCQYGAIVHETASSQTGAEKAHALFVLDRPLTDPAAVKEALKALHFRYPHVDRVHDAARVWYGAPAANCHLLGNICPYDVFEREILIPYRQERERLREEKAALAAQHQNAFPNANIETTTDGIEHYITKSLDGVYRFVATRAEGERHKAILWAGTKIGALQAASWINPAWLGDVDSEIIRACGANGYVIQESKKEILRTFYDGIRTGHQSPAAYPQHRVTAARPNGTDPGPKALARQKQKEAFLTEREADQERQKPVYRPEAIPWAIAGPDDYIEVIKERRAFSRADQWKIHVEINFHELNPEVEYRRKLEENREARIGLCGQPFQMTTATGEVVTRHLLCGYCETCRKIDRENLRQALGAALGAINTQDITVITVASKRERAQWVRRCRDNGILYKVYPVERDGQIVYDLLIAVRRDEGEILDILLITDDRLAQWVETPAGERKSGRLIPGTKELRRQNGEKLKYECDPKEPDAVALILYGIVTGAEYVSLPHLPVEEVRTLEGLQSALADIHKRSLTSLSNRGHVILGVTTKMFYTPKTTLPDLIAEFNANNKTGRGPKGPDEGQTATRPEWARGQIR